MGNCNSGLLTPDELVELKEKKERKELKNINRKVNKLSERAIKLCGNAQHTAPGLSSWIVDVPISTGWNAYTLSSKMKICINKLLHDTYLRCSDIKAKYTFFDRKIVVTFITDKVPIYEK